MPKQAGPQPPLEVVQDPIPLTAAVLQVDLSPVTVALLALSPVAAAVLALSPVPTGPPGTSQTVALVN